MLAEKLFAPGLAVVRSLPIGMAVSIAAMLSAVPTIALLWLTLSGADAAQTGSALSIVGCTCFVLLLYLLFSLRRSIKTDLQQLGTAAEQLIHGNLRVQLNGRDQDELGRLMHSVALLSRTVSEMVANVRSNAAFVAHAGQSLARKLSLMR